MASYLGGRHPAAGELLFRVTTHDGKRVRVTEPVSQLQLSRLKLTTFHCARAKCAGVYGFLHPRAKKWMTFGKGCRDLGVVGGIMLDLLQRNPGIYFDKLMLYVKTGLTVLAGAEANQYVHRLRQSFAEDDEHQYFVKTLNGGVAWPRHLTWVIVEPILPAETAPKQQARHASTSSAIAADPGMSDSDLQATGSQGTIRA